VASRCRQAHHHCHQHATLGGVVLAISAVVTLFISGACTVHGTGAPGAARCAPIGAVPRTDGQLLDDGPQGGDQPPSRWGGQSHHHRVQPQEASRHRGPQPRKRLRPTCTSGCAPSCTCTSPPWLHGSFGGGGGAWCWLHTYVWWSGHPSSDPTCQRSTTGRSTPPSSCRSTPSPSSRLGGMRLSWPTTSP
jgi:hypothetical protein